MWVMLALFLAMRSSHRPGSPLELAAGALPSSRDPHCSSQRR
jgi:hypothetical protein